MAEPEAVKVRRLTRWQRIGIAALLLLCAGVIGGAVFIWSGYYNVGANRAHLDVTTWLLTVVRDQSIRAHSDSVTVPPLDGEMARLGAEHYRSSCAGCHGMPGEGPGPTYEAMLPSPPDLLSARDDYESAGLFWIVSNGLKYTGMPAWPGEGRTDEAWSVVAYLESLEADGGPDKSAALGTAQGNCVRCHGDAETAPISDLVPRLDVLGADYMARAIEEYRDGTRPSGFMAPVVHEMGNSEVDALLEYYAALDQPHDAEDRLPVDLVAAGRGIAEQGIPDADVPACDSCHGPERGSQFPGLDGQSQRYIATQLKLWAAGHRGETSFGRIMQVVAARLTPDDIEAVSAYYAGLAADDAEMTP